MACQGSDLLLPGGGRLDVAAQHFPQVNPRPTPSWVPEGRNQICTAQFPETAPAAHQLKNARQHEAFRRLRKISVRVLVLAVVERLGGLRLRRPVEQEAEVGSDERVWCRDRVGVVRGSFSRANAM
jgi:hypothetical protein